jgi:hypothetical protein
MLVGQVTKVVVVMVVMSKVDDDDDDDDYHHSNCLDIVAKSAFHIEGSWWIL